MREHLVRIIFLCVLMFIVSSDINDLLNSRTLQHIGHWIGRVHGKFDKEKRSIITRNTNIPTLNSPAGSKFIKDDENSVPGVDQEDLRLASASLEPGSLVRPDSADSTSSLKGLRLTDEEKLQLAALKSHWTKVMQQHCLPKLVCELHAAVTDGTAVSDAERGLLSLIKDTSLGTSGEIVSRYHFAAHMGQLLSGVEGNGCHNFYPNCPISGTKVLQMVRRVRV